MDVFKIAKEINAHNSELSNAGISVIMAVSDDNGNMCICSVGKLLDQLRGLATNFITLRKAFIKSYSKKEWDEVWQKILAEQTINLMINEKTGEFNNDER